MFSQKTKRKKLLDLGVNCLSRDEQENRKQNRQKVNRKVARPIRKHEIGGSGVGQVGPYRKAGCCCCRDAIGIRECCDDRGGGDLRCCGERRGATSVRQGRESVDEIELAVEVGLRACWDAIRVCQSCYCWNHHHRRDTDEDAARGRMDNAFYPHLTRRRELGR